MNAILSHSPSPSPLQTSGPWLCLAPLPWNTPASICECRTVNVCVGSLPSAETRMATPMMVRGVPQSPQRVSYCCNGRRPAVNENKSFCSVLNSSNSSEGSRIAVALNPSRSWGGSWVMGMQRLSVGVRSWEGSHKCPACHPPQASLPWQVRKTSAPLPSVTDAALVFPLPSSLRWLEIPPLREGWHSRAGKWPRLMKNKVLSDGRSFTVAHMFLLSRCNGGLCKCWIGTEPKTHKTKRGRQAWTPEAAVYGPWSTVVSLITAASAQNIFASKHTAWS